MFVIGGMRVPCNNDGTGCDGSKFSKSFVRGGLKKEFFVVFRATMKKTQFVYTMLACVFFSGCKDTADCSG